MNLEHVRDWLKTIYPDAVNYYVGTLDANKDQSIGVYQLHRLTPANNRVGGGASTKRKPVSLLVHWSNNATATETAAKALYDAIRSNYREQTIGMATADYIKLLNNEPLDVGQDENGVFERVIELEIYFREGE